MIVYIGNDHIVRFSGATVTRLDTGEDVFLDGGATVTFRIQTEAHVDVTGETWPVALSYLGSDGNFIGVLRNEVVLEPNDLYRFVGTADFGVDMRATWDIPVQALVRSS